jgi:hypothetical protein
LNSEEKFATVVKEAGRIRDEFGLTVVPLKAWDTAEGNTYFSPQTLRNMIAALEYTAKGSLAPSSGPERSSLIQAFLKDQAAFAPTISFTGDPAEAILSPACPAKDHTSLQ